MPGENAATKLFPAGAGVIPLSSARRIRSRTVPRRGGGDPDSEQGVLAKMHCSPQGRG